MSEALRRAGVDEVLVAEHFAAIITKLSGKSEDKDGVEKLFVDILKECTRHLDSPRAPGIASASSSAADPVVIVNLIHEVARPNRPTPASIAASASDIAASEPVANAAAPEAGPAPPE